MKWFNQSFQVGTRDNYLAYYIDDVLLTPSLSTPLHYISYLVLYRAFVAFPLIQKTILNMDLPTRLVGLQHLGACLSRLIAAIAAPESRIWSPVEV
jgi:hypothetical protein